MVFLKYILWALNTLLNGYVNALMWYWFINRNSSFINSVCRLRPYLHIIIDCQSFILRYFLLSYKLTTVMKTLTSACLLLLLSCLSELVESRTLLLNSCSVNVHTQELRKYYSSIRSNAVSSIQTNYQKHKLNHTKIHNAISDTVHDILKWMEA